MTGMEVYVGLNKEYKDNGVHCLYACPRITQEPFIRSTSHLVFVLLGTYSVEFGNINTL